MLKFLNRVEYGRKFLFNGCILRHSAAPFLYFNFESIGEVIRGVKNKHASLLHVCSLTANGGTVLEFSSYSAQSPLNYISLYTSTNAVVFHVFECKRIHIAEFRLMRSRIESNTRLSKSKDCSVRLCEMLEWVKEWVNEKLNNELFGACASGPLLMPSHITAVTQV